MGRAISITLGAHLFKIKYDLIRFIREVVDRYQVGDYLNAEDTRFCMTLFESHSNYPDKLAPGVARIQLLIQEKGSRGFQIHKLDGTSGNISWTDCVNNRE
ncbi:hypothetical protein BTH42_31915 [Burkholderia sp. SRS-W-2-2016]|uniref:DUF3223 domain-containing protein n=1 Tax=Burkholderia sp. SRS-W-2-2016 TaxID=1926878 RepID=UPI00094ACFBF|nr:hypothetical protein BTH42_31915 [Burkholderia sp. SRS-W-2-2016]